MIAVACHSDYEGEALIYDYLQSRPEDEEPPCLYGRVSHHPINDRPVIFSPRVWGTDNGLGLRVLMHWPDSRVVGTQGPVPLQAIQDKYGNVIAYSDTARDVHKTLTRYGALPEGVYTNDRVQLPRTIVLDIMRFAGLPIPDELLKELMPEELPKQPVVILRPAPANTTPESAPHNPSVPATGYCKEWVPNAMKAYPQKPGEALIAWARRLKDECGAKQSPSTIANHIWRTREPPHHTKKVANRTK
jgi:hypothetical protein